MEDDAASSRQARRSMTAPATEPVEPAPSRAPTSSVRVRAPAAPAHGSHDRLPGRIVAVTRGWVSRDGALHVFAARFLDFAVLTPEHLVSVLHRILHAAGRAAACSASRSTGSWWSREGPSRNARCGSVGDFETPAAVRAARHAGRPSVRARARRADAPARPARTARRRGHRAMTCVIAIDAGTTGVRAVRRRRRRPCRAPARTASSRSTSRSRAGSSTTPTTSGGSRSRRSARSRAELDAAGETVAAIGITNQRETVVVWDRRTGRPRAPRDRLAGPPHRARAATSCAPPGHEPMIRRATGLVLDPVLLGDEARRGCCTTGGVAADADLVFGTVDTWILWNLTGGADGGVHATDPSNASRTMLYDIGAGAWSDELAALFDVPRVVPARRCAPSSGRFGVTRARARGRARGAGQRHRRRPAGRAVRPGVRRAGHDEEHVRHRIVRAHQRRPDAARAGRRTAHDGRVVARPSDDVTYAMEGAIFVTGAAIQWLRDGLGVIADAAETGPLAASVPDSGGVYVVPAFTGLGSPWWDAYARGTIVGHHARHEPRAPRARGRRVDGVPDRRRRRRDHARERHRARRDARRRRRVGDGPALPVPGRPARRARAPRRGAGDDRARRRVPRRPRRGRLGLARAR